MDHDPPSKDEAAPGGGTTQDEPSGSAPGPAVRSKVEVDPSLTAAGPVSRAPGASRPASERPAAPKRPAPRERDPLHPRLRPGTEEPRGRRLWGLPLWGWALAVFTFLAVLLVVLDLRNRNRFVMVCRASSVELLQGRRFPWPFGHEAVGGEAFRPVKIPAEADCRSRVYASREEAERDFLDFLIAQVRTALTHTGDTSLKEARRQVLQALILTRTYRSRRKDVQTLLAEVAYREGRHGLTRAEDELRRALASFKEAQKLDAERYEDLEEWITHLEDLLRTISPSPSQAARSSLPLSPAPLPRPAPGQPGSRPPPGPAAPTGDGRPSGSAPDAGSAAGGSGILL